VSRHLQTYGSFIDNCDEEFEIDTQHEQGNSTSSPGARVANDEQTVQYLEPCESSSPEALAMDDQYDDSVSQLKCG